MSARGIASGCEVREACAWKVAEDRADDNGKLRRSSAAASAELRVQELHENSPEFFFSPGAPGVLAVIFFFSTPC
jgi:hypothetical protein